MLSCCEVDLQGKIGQLNQGTIYVQKIFHKWLFRLTFFDQSWEVYRQQKFQNIGNSTKEYRNTIRWDYTGTTLPETIM